MPNCCQVCGSGTGTDELNGASAIQPVRRCTAARLHGRDCEGLRPGRDGKRVRCLCALCRSYLQPNRRRYGKAERLRSRFIDHKLELPRLHDRKFRCLRVLEDRAAEAGVGATRPLSVEKRWVGAPPS